MCVKIMPAAAARLTGHGSCSLHATASRSLAMESHSRVCRQYKRLAATATAAEAAAAQSPTGRGARAAGDFLK